MKRSVLKFRMNARDWVWGPTAYWKVCSPAKKTVLPLFNHEFLRCMTSAVGNYQEHLLKVYKTTIVRARKAARPNYYGLQNHGRFGSALNSFIINEKRKQHLSRRNFMNESADIVLSKDEINSILRAQENTALFDSKLVRRVDFNELNSNKPIEDQSFAYRSSYDDSLIIGLLDGHGGNAFAEKVKSYLPMYISAALADNKLKSILDDKFHLGLLAESFLRKTPSKHDGFLHDKVQNFAREVASRSASDEPGTFSTYVRQILGSASYSMEEKGESVEISDALKEAFLRLDLDLINDVIDESKRGNNKPKDSLKMASSGCCALVANINGSELSVANAGDCRAVMGSLHGEEWAAIQLTYDHTAMANPDEVQRILAEHPGEESRTCIQYGRLLGRLAPLRAFGDMRFKIDAELQKALIGKLDPKFKTFSGLKTPPYLTAEPEVFQYKLEKSDKFIVLATDGLWDMLSNQEVVELVGSFMEGHGADAMKKRAISSSIPNLDDILSSEDTGDVENDNVATFLIRCALGGFDYWSLSAMLTLPHPDVRMYRDDISVIVIFFDHENSAK